jgi:HlyD family secretion protein
MNANANAKVHTHVHQPLDTLKAFRRLALPLLLGLASIFVVVAQARGLRRGAETALGSLTGGRLGTASAGARAGAAAAGGREPASLTGGAGGAGSAGSDGAAAEAAGADALLPEAGAAAAGSGRVVAEGRLVAYPGAEVVVGSDVAGTLIRLTVQEKQTVRRGQLVAELRADDLRAQLAAAQAKAAEAAADVRFAAKDAERSLYLAAQNAGTQREAERTASGRDSAAARLETARAEVRRLAAVLAKTRIVAPIDGTVMDRAAQPGEHVEAGAPLLTIADLRRTRIEAEVDEFDAGHVRLGAPVRVAVEGYDGRSWRAHVEEVPDSVVARKLRPQDPGRPADTRVLLVKIALDEPSPIKLGQRVEVAITPPPPPRPIG